MQAQWSQPLPRENRASKSEMVCTESSLVMYAPPALVLLTGVGGMTSGDAELVGLGIGHHHVELAVVPGLPQDAPAQADEAGRLG